MFLNLFNQLPVGLRYMLMSTLGFALMSVCVKAVSAHGIPVFEIVAARALISLLLSTIDIRRKKLSVWGHNKPLLIARGTAGTIALMGAYYAVTTLPLAEATVIQYLHPVFTALLALLFLKESIRRSNLICILLSLLGLAIMVQPGMDSEIAHNLPTISIIAALVGAFGSAVAYVLVRRLSQSEDSSVIIFYFPLISLPLSLMLLGNDFVMPTPWTLALLILVGIFTQIGQIGLTHAMKTDNAAKATAYSYIQVIFSVALGWILFDEIPVLTTVIGGGLIMCGAVINVFGGRGIRGSRET